MTGVGRLAVYTHVSAEALEEFLLRYDVGELVSAKGIAEGVENSNYMVDTTQGRFILTLYEKRVEAGDLPYFMALLDHLAGKDLPVPPAIKDRTGAAIQELEGRQA
jgi:homoserine kinase type II